MELKPCIACKFDRAAFDKHKKEMKGSSYFSKPQWDKYKPVLFKDLVLNQWVIECQNCGTHFLLHEPNEKETIRHWNSLDR